MSANTLFVVLWLVGCVAVAGIMELMKKATKQDCRKIWWVFGFMLSCAMTCSCWFGVEGHFGNDWLIAVFIVAGYFFQFHIDMQYVKKLADMIIRAYLKKHGLGG